MLELITLLGIGFSFGGSLHLAHRSMSSWRETLDKQEERYVQQLQPGKEKLVEEGVLEPGDVGFDFLVQRIREHTDHRISISRFEMPDSSGVFPTIDIIANDGTRYDEVMNTATYVNWNEERAEDLRRKSDDSKVLLGTTLLAIGFLLQGIGISLTNLGIV